MFKISIDEKISHRCTDYRTIICASVAYYNNIPDKQLAACGLLLVAYTSIF